MGHRVMANLGTERVICRVEVAIKLSSDTWRVRNVDRHACLRNKPVIVNNCTGRSVGTGQVYLFVAFGAMLLPPLPKSQ